MAKVEDLSIALKQNTPSKKKFVILPTAWLFLIWEGLIAFTCLLTTLFVTFQKAYKSDEYVLVSLLHGFDFVYLIHIGIKFNLGYVKKGTLILEKEKIKENYLKTTFILDAISFVKLPLQLVTYIDGVGLQFKQVVRGLELLKILRFYNLTACFGKMILNSDTPCLNFPLEHLKIPSIVKLFKLNL